MVLNIQIFHVMVDRVVRLFLIGSDVDLTLEFVCFAGETVKSYYFILEICVKVIFLWKSGPAGCLPKK